MKNKKLRWSIVSLVIAAVAIYFFYLKPHLASQKVEYTYTTLVKGGIESTISSTGTLGAINTIQVGTQISGTIKKIHVDYNYHVMAGQLLAEMDTRQLVTTLENAQANLALMETRLQQAKEDDQRNTTLWGKKVIPEKEFKNTRYAYEQALSNKKAADASVKSAKVNLGYAYITSPINGTVTERNVEEGQTVAASFATPTLFIIAENLSKMQILAAVDESDIGYISKGMDVRFTVQTYPDQKFYGKVSQIRLEPSRINNVVNYTIVIQVDNKNGVLLPGMTANLDFIYRKADDVLIINNSALRFHPDSRMLKQIKPVMTEKAKYLPDSIRSAFLADLESETSFVNGQFRKVLPRKLNCIFYTTKTGQINFDFVQLGITTGQESSIDSFLTGSPLLAGEKLINGIQSAK